MYPIFVSLKKNGGSLLMDEKIEDIITQYLVEVFELRLKYYHTIDPDVQDYLRHQIIDRISKIDAFKSLLAPEKLN